MIPDNISIKIINLEHRTDRKDECIKELHEIGLTDDQFKFFVAKLDSDNGAIGASLSHAKVLSDWLFNESTEYCLVFEDDFHILDSNNFWDPISKVMQYKGNWNAYLLASNLAIPIEATPLEGIFKVINAQTASAYLVGRLYAAKLIEVFYKSAELMRLAKSIPTLSLETTKHFYALDSLWKDLQISGTFWASWPQLALQRPSFSDIEQRDVDYKA